MIKKAIVFIICFILTQLVSWVIIFALAWLLHNVVVPDLYYISTGLGLLLLFIIAIGDEFSNIKL